MVVGPSVEAGSVKKREPRELLCICACHMCTPTPCSVDIAYLIVIPNFFSSQKSQGMVLNYFLKALDNIVFP